MGVVTEVEGAQLILHWMGTYGGDPFKGEWKRTFVDTDNKRLHVNSSLKSKYDNWFTCHWVYLFDIIGEPFELLEGGHLPKRVVDLSLLKRRELRLKRGKSDEWLTSDLGGGLTLVMFFW